MQADYRKQFAESDAGKRWHNASAESWFQEGIKVALATFTTPTANDMGSAAANWYRFEGARMFAARLCDLTEPARPRQIDPNANLKHQI